MHIVTVIFFIRAFWLLIFQTDLSREIHCGYNIISTLFIYELHNKQAKMKIYCTQTHRGRISHQYFAPKHFRNIWSLMSRITWAPVLKFGFLSFAISRFSPPSLPLVPSKSLSSSFLLPSSASLPSVSQQQFSFNCVLSHLIPLRIIKN